MKYKRYDSKEIIRRATKVVCGMSGIDDIYKPLLVDIIARRAYEYDLSPYQIRNDLRNLKRSLKEIKIDNMPKGHESALGVYRPARKSILLSKKMFTEGEPDYIEIYDTLTHEVYHALSRDKDGNDKLLSVNMFTGKKNKGLMEAVISKAANRTTLNQYYDNIFYKRDSHGYDDTVFVVDLIAAAYGISEKEFLKSALKGKENLIQELSSRKRINPGLTIQFLDTIDLNLTRIDNVERFGKKHKNLSGEDKDYLVTEITDSLAGIFLAVEKQFTTIYMLNRRDNSQSPEILDDEFQYSHSKIQFIKEKTLEMFSEMYGYNFAPGVARAVKQIKALNENIYNYIEEKRDHNIFENVIDRMKEEDFTDELWKNDGIKYYIKKYLQPVATKPFISKVKSLGRRLTGKKLQIPGMHQAKKQNTHSRKREEDYYDEER